MLKSVGKAPEQHTTYCAFNLQINNKFDLGGAPSHLKLPSKRLLVLL
jgi:hypothetical protein